MYIFPICTEYIALFGLVQQREWVEDGFISASHVSGKCNPTDISTKEMRNAANFCRICDAFMSHGSDFLKGIYACLSESVVTPPLHVAHTAHYVRPDRLGILEVILSHSAFRTSVAILCLSNAGRHILSQVSLLSCRTLSAIAWGVL